METVNESTGAPLRLGSRVKLARRALHGDPAHPFAFAVGSVVNIAPLRGGRYRVAVQWDDGPGSCALASNLVRVDRVHLERC